MVSFKFWLKLCDTHGSNVGLTWIYPYLHISFYKLGSVERGAIFLSDDVKKMELWYDF